MRNPTALVREIESSGFLDEVWYQKRYLDFELLGVSAGEHYVRIGAKLLRDPGPDFSTAFYLASNPDVMKCGMNPLLHYIRHGRAEGRESMPADARSTPDTTSKSSVASRLWKSIRGLEKLDAEKIRQVESAFDHEFYLAQNEDVRDAVIDPFVHYLARGWLEGRDPAPKFSTSYYLDRVPNIRKRGMNPLVHYVVHGIGERRQTLPYRRRLEALEYEPKVSVIVPNYNHGRYLEERVESIIRQTYRNFEILLLDDCSTDDSGDVIKRLHDRYPDRIRFLVNDTNSGGVFRQWRKGVENSDGELVWICESDDFCEPDFLELMVAQLKDRSVQIAFGRIQFSHSDGSFREGLDRYREGAEPGIWSKPTVRPASQWFAGGFGVNNVIANVGGCVWRRQALPESVWNEAQRYTILGDWYLYCQIAGGGQIAYEPAAVAYFRQHGKNTSVTSFEGPIYYQEHQRLMTSICRRWDIPADTINRFAEKVHWQYQHHKLERKLGSFESYVDVVRLKQEKRQTPHLLIAILGFHPGGGELLPINLANALRKAGWLVSLLAFDMSDVNQEMLASVDRSIPVYFADQVEEIGVETFMANAGISLIHSHMVSLESFLIGRNEIDRKIPYLVTLHGSYEACGFDGDRLVKVVKRVDHWVYTADRNLTPFKSFGLPSSKFTKIPNGMQIDPRPFPYSRAQLGIAEDATIFAFVARGVAGKGWPVATEAFSRLRRAHPERRMHLLMCGIGTEADKQKAKHDKDPDITFLGYQSCIHGLYRMSDCALVPTRFAGESFPLCIIQALQTSTPVIATRVGEIQSMIAPEGHDPAGLLVDNTSDNERFIDDIENAMAAMLDDTRRNSLSSSAKRVGVRYHIDDVASTYANLYRRMLASVPMDTSPTNTTSGRKASGVQA